MRLLTLVMCLLLSLAVQAADLRVIVVRHAEKATDDKRDPTLSAAGKERAKALAQMLRDEPLVATYATQYRRTQLTAAPSAYASKLRVTVRPAGESAASLAAQIKHKHENGSVLVVGHSNTVPDIVAALSGQEITAIADEEFDRYYIVSWPAQGSAKLESGRYPPPADPLPAAAAR